MMKGLRLARRAVLFLGSTALIFLGIRFLVGGVAGAWSLPLAAIFLGVGVATWVSRDALASVDPQTRFLAVGSIAMNGIVAFLGWSILSGVEGGPANTASLVVIAIASVNIGGVLLGQFDRSGVDDH